MGEHQPPVIVLKAIVMNKLTIGTRLVLGFTFLLVLIAILGGLGVWRLEATELALADVTRLQSNERLVAGWDKNIALNTTRTIAAARSNDPETQRFFEQEMQETSRHGEQIHQQLRERLQDPQAVELFEQVLQLRARYRDARASALKAQEQGELDAGSHFIETQMQPLLKAYLQGVANLLSHQQELVQQVSAEARARNDIAKLAFVVLAALALLGGALLAFITTRSIVRPLSHAVTVAEAVASRDLTASIQATGRDETGVLLRALQQMTVSLRQVVGNVRQGSQEIASAAGQILAGNHDLSARTEEQAASLTETAAAMEQLTATVQQTADNAQQASTLATSAVEVARRGEDIVAQTVTTMDAINDASKRVEDIIGVIDSIAFQTNILALNAAVESARAGEAGRGFAVVAGEVRSLAQRSAQAAREIKDLIGDSVNAAQSGHQLVTRTGATMQEIGEAIQRLNDIIGEISAASQEQSAGIQQVNEAVGQMDQTMRQNAAMVEEATVAADHLQHQAAHLADLVATFRVADKVRTSKPALPAMTADHDPAPISGTSGRPAVAALPDGTTRPKTATAATQRAGRASKSTTQSSQAQDEWEEF